jgi:hypothetical protein
MAEQITRRGHSENLLLDIGGDIGALIIYTRAELLGRELEISLKEGSAKRVHNVVRERRFNGRQVFAAVFPELPAGAYTLWLNKIETGGEVSISGGAISEVDWRDIVDPLAPYLDAAPPTTSEATGRQLRAYALPDFLPPRYRDGRSVSAAPMGSAPMQYDAAGQVAWDKLWSGFCDLALAGGPPHRDTLLEPADPQEVRDAPADYEHVLAEIERGLRLVSGLPVVRSPRPGWIGLRCDDEEMALWLLRAIIVENVCVRREGTILYLPAGPGFRLEKEIKNVVTVVAKTSHYWTEHLLAQNASSNGAS